MIDLNLRKLGNDGVGEREFVKTRGRVLTQVLKRQYRDALFSLCRSPLSEMSGANDGVASAGYLRREGRFRLKLVSGVDLPVNQLSTRLTALPSAWPGANVSVGINCAPATCCSTARSSSRIIAIFW